MKKTIILNKPQGLTPLQAVESFLKKNPNYKNIKIGYAGRLDPMANGALLLLIEDENKKFNNYMKLDKEYKAQILLGFQTDTYDLLGIAKPSNYDLKDIKKRIPKLQGPGIQELPIYSSYIIKGKPLFWYARNNKKIKLVKNKIKIKNIKLTSLSTINNKKLLAQILKKISNVDGDFRQTKIKNHWKKLLKAKQTYPIITITIKCSSGTYIRSIANQLNACLYSLKRTKIGKYGISKKQKYL